MSTDTRRTAGTISSTHPRDYVPKASRRTRAEALRSLLPTGESVLEIGARDGYFSLCLSEYFTRVTALDLEKLPWDLDRVTFVEGDVRALQFPDNHFDCTVCTEVLEHIDDVQRAAAELARVTKPGGAIVVSVPFEQDLRVGRTRCGACGRPNPAYGHLHSFTLDRLRSLFPACQAEEVKLPGSVREVTTALSARLSELADFPYGSYSQGEPCIHCGGKVEPPANPSFAARLAAFAAAKIDAVLSRLSKPKPQWAFVRFRK